MARKRSTFGHLTQRKNRHGWYVRVRRNGRAIIRYAGSDFRTAEAFVARWRRLHEQESLLGQKAIPAVTLAEIEREFLQHLAARHSPTSRAANEQRLVQLKAELGKVPLRDIDRAAVEDLLTRLKVKRGLAHATVNRYASLLSVALKYAVDRGFARENPVRGIRREREELRPVPFVSDADVVKLVAGASNPELAGLIRLLSDTGLRRSEALALQWRDVDLKRDLLVVRRSKTREPREVPLTSAARAVLVDQARRVETLPHHGQGTVWASLATVPPDGVTKRFRTIAKRAGFPDLRLHDLRHGFACRLREAGVAIQVIAQLAGHKSLTTTLRYSRHMATNSLRDAINALERNGTGVLTECASCGQVPQGSITPQMRAPPQQTAALPDG